MTEKILNASSEARQIKNVMIIRVMGAAYSSVEDHSFILSVLENLCDECYKNGLIPTVEICKNEETVSTYERALKEGFDAVILLAYDLSDEYLDELRKRDLSRLPFVVVGNVMEGKFVSTVNLANAEICYMAVRHLFECGFKSVGYLHSDYDYWCFRDRAVGFRSAVDDLGLKSPVTLPVSSTITGAYRDIAAWLKRGPKIPRAFFADNDNTAIGAINAFIEAGIQVPEDVSIIAMDDIVYSAFAKTPLTTIHVSRKQLAREAVDILVGSMPKSPVRVSCMGSLLIRKSTRKFDYLTEEEFVVPVRKQREITV